MKKIIALLIMSFLLVSCGASNEEANESNNKKVTEAVENTDATVTETVETTTGGTTESVVIDETTSTGTQDAPVEEMTGTIEK